MLLGAVRDKLGSSEPQEPFSIEDARPLCTEANGDSCILDGRTTYYSVEARADAPVRLMEGETREVTLGGIAYKLKARPGCVRGQVRDPGLDAARRQRPTLSHARAVVDALAGDKRLCEFDNAKHEQLALADRARWDAALDRFLAERLHVAG